MAAAGARFGSPYVYFRLRRSHRSVTDDYKLKMYVRIVRLLLEDGDTVSAQTYLSRAQSLIRTTNDQETIRACILL